MPTQPSLAHDRACYLLIVKFLHLFLDIRQDGKVGGQVPVQLGRGKGYHAFTEISHSHAQLLALPDDALDAF